MNNLNFSNWWFESTAKPVWDEIIPKLKPKKILEVGSFEGASACYLIQNLSNTPMEIHCIDTWQGGVEHQPEGHDQYDMTKVKQVFDKNISTVMNSNVNLQIHQGSSDIEMSKLLSSNYKDYFDFIYIDGSHLSCDVLCDAVLGFKLLNIGGVMVFDDYAWHYSDKNLHKCPKLAIDSFINIYWPKLEITSTPAQLIIQKISN